MCKCSQLMRFTSFTRNVLLRDKCLPGYSMEGMRHAD